jgi:hypothetical protein
MRGGFIILVTMATSKKLKRLKLKAKRVFFEGKAKNAQMKKKWYKAMMYWRKCLFFVNKMVAIDLLGYSIPCGYVPILVRQKRVKDTIEVCKLMHSERDQLAWAELAGIKDSMKIFKGLLAERYALDF